MRSYNRKGFDSQTSPPSNMPEEWYNLWRSGVRDLGRYPGWSNTNGSLKNVFKLPKTAKSIEGLVSQIVGWGGVRNRSGALFF